MTKREMIEKIAHGNLISKKFASEIYDSILYELRKEFKKNGSVRITGIGTIRGFKVKPHYRYNFNDNKIKWYPKKIRRVTLKPSSKLRAAIK